MNLLSTFIWPAISTLVLILTEIFYMKRKNAPWYYVQFFLIILSISLLLFRVNLEAA